MVVDSDSESSRQEELRKKLRSAALKGSSLASPSPSPFQPPYSESAIVYDASPKVEPDSIDDVPVTKKVLAIRPPELRPSLQDSDTLAALSPLLLKPKSPAHQDSPSSLSPHSPPSPANPASPPVSPWPTDLSFLTPKTTVPSPEIKAFEPLLHTALETLRYCRTHSTVLKRIEQDNPSEYRSGCAYQDLKRELKLFNDDLKSLYELFNPITALISESARLTLTMAFESLNVAIQSGMLTHMREAVEQRAKQAESLVQGKGYVDDHLWWTVTNFLPSPQDKKWEQLVEHILGKRQKTERRSDTPERIPTSFQSLDAKAQAALISVPDGTIQILFAHVLDPNFSSYPRRLFWLVRRKGKCGGSELCKLDPRLQNKIGFRCSCPKAFVPKKRILPLREKTDSEFGTTTTIFS